MSEDRYQDYVIKDGRLVGDFESLYETFEDPWHQSRVDHPLVTRRSIALAQCIHLRAMDPTGQVNRVVEIGCGFGHLTDSLRQQGFSAVGTDVSATAVTKAREKNPSSVFMCASIDSPSYLSILDPDIVIMAEVTWYVLDQLPLFLERIREYAQNRKRPTYLIHLLSTYPTGVQKYGKEYFTDLDGILNFFKLDYLESGFVQVNREDDPGSQGTYFIARVPRE
jgi:SAM-dependent methyltransferase